MNFFKKTIKRIAYKIYQLGKSFEREKILKPYKFDSTVRLGEVYLEGPVTIGACTYMNSGLLVAGDHSKISIGRHCTIGRNVHIRSRTHDLTRPTSDENFPKHIVVEADIKVGDYVWIGDNVLVKPGINIGDNAIIGANSIVIKDVRPFEIVGGVPAKHIRFNTQHYRYVSE